MILWEIYPREKVLNKRIDFGLLFQTLKLTTILYFTPVCQFTMARAAKISILGHIRVESQLFCGLSFRQVTFPFCC